MINKLHIRAFKSIRELSLDCSNLNLFVGTNSSGKSSVLQALLLFQQNHTVGFGLNGNYISLGEFREIRNNTMLRENITITIEGTNRSGELDSEEVKFIETDSGYKTIPALGSCEMSKLEDTLRRMQKYYAFYYLSCHRIGVMDLYQKNISLPDRFGKDGEYTLAYLADHSGDSLSETICKTEGGIGNDLLSQVNYWLKYIVGTELSISKLPQTNYVQVKYNNNVSIQNTSSYQRPINVGSGVSYLISVIIVCLASEKGSVIILENPEIHLHPKAQSRLCELLYLIAQSGRQLFVETHSDHIFNAIRVGISTEVWNPELINVNFLALDENYTTQCNKIKFGPFGKVIGTNPKMNLTDLFDQFEIDLDKMLGL